VAFSSEEIFESFVDSTASSRRPYFKADDGYIFFRRKGDERRLDLTPEEYAVRRKRQTYEANHRIYMARKDDPAWRARRSAHSLASYYRNREKRLAYQRERDRGRVRKPKPKATNAPKYAPRKKAYRERIKRDPALAAAAKARKAENQRLRRAQNRAKRLQKRLEDFRKARENT
jgi:hypothetical protein